MRRLAIFDAETTGIDVESDHIVSAFFGILDENGELEEAHDYLVKQDQPIPAEATAVHGITTEYANEHGQEIEEVTLAITLDFQRCINERIPVCGHNLAYDLTLLDREIYRSLSGEEEDGVQAYLDAGLIVLDSLVIDKHIDRYRKGKRTLITAAEVYGVALSEEEAHGARADAIASGRIMQKQLEDFVIKPYGPKALMKAQAQWKAEQARSLQEYFRTKAPEPNPAAYVDPNWPLIPRPTEDGAE